VSVAIIGGTGDEGFGLALRLARAGEHVVIGSRSEERGQAAAEKGAELLGLGSGSGTRGSIAGTSNEHAAAGSEVVFVTVPYAGQADIYRSIRDSLRSGAVQAKAILPKDARLVSGFHTVSAEPLQDMQRSMEGDVLLCGSDGDAKATIGGLVEKIPNLRWADAGLLSMARILERLTAVMVSVNRAYGIKQAGISLTGRESWGAPGTRA
jgi:predicted dinucleotide-binding enzyme